MVALWQHLSGVAAVVATPAPLLFEPPRYAAMQVVLTPEYSITVPCIMNATQREPMTEAEIEDLVLALNRIEVMLA